MTEQESILRQIGEQMADPFVVTDARGRTQWVNRQFVELCGHQVEELEGRKPGQVLQGKDTNQRTTERIRAAIAAGEPCDAKLLNYHKDGHAYWVALQIRPLFDCGGRLTHFFAIERELPGPGPQVIDPAEAVETLSICSSCKRVSNGRGEWQPFESFWTERAAVQFSHGSCPTCLVDWRWDSDF